MYGLYFETEEKAKAFIEEISNLGYEWSPARLYQPKTGVYRDSYCLQFYATAKVFKDIEKRYFES